MELVAKNLVRQPVKKFRNEHRAVGEKCVIGQTHFCRAGGKLQYGDVRHLAAGAAGGGNYDEPLVAHGRYLFVEEIEHGVIFFQREQLRRVDDRAAAYRDDTFVGNVLNVVVYPLDHRVGGFARAVVAPVDDVRAVEQGPQMPTRKIAP